MGKRQNPQGRKATKAIYIVRCLYHKKDLARVQGRDVAAVKAVHRAVHPMTCPTALRDRKAG